MKNEYVEEIKRLEREDKKTIDKALSMVTPERAVEIRAEMEEADGFTSSFEIVSEPVGEYYKDMNYWVNQTCNGGWSGDDFAGTICHKLTDDKFLKYHYSM